VLLVSSSRHPEQWIVPGGGVEPEEEPSGAAVREVFEEAGVRGKLGRLVGVFEHNENRKHRTYVYVLTVTETLEDWEDSVNIGKKRKWFKVDEAIRELQRHRPDHAQYLRTLIKHYSPTRGPVTDPVCGPVCAPANGNSTSEHSPPHYELCSTDSERVNR
ncbi:hypothetical protein NL108_017994, partial [Boleophthalmus pectinirostris]